MAISALHGVPGIGRPSSSLPGGRSCPAPGTPQRLRAHGTVPPRDGLGPDRLDLSPTSEAATSASKSRRNRKDTKLSWWETLVYATPYLDDVHRGLTVGAQATGATIAATKVPGFPGILADGQKAAGILGRLRILPMVEKVFGSRAFDYVSRVLSSPLFQTVGKIAGRLMPFVGAGFAFFDVRAAYRAVDDPEASSLRKTLKTIKAAISVVGAGAGLATLVLAPTGVGALVAGAVSIGAGLLGLGLDFLTSHIAPR